MNHARADALAARSHLAAHGWIARNAESFRHLPPPDLALWLGPDEASARKAAPADGGWQLDEFDPAWASSVEVMRLDASVPYQRRELLAGLAHPGDDAAAPFAWAHRVLMTQGLRLRIRPTADGAEPLLRVIRRPVDCVEAPLLVIELLPGARCALLEVHEAGAAQPRDGIAQNLQVHVLAGANSSLRHLRVALPAGADSVAQHVHVRLQEGAAYEQALLAGGARYHLQRTVLELDQAGARARTGSVLLAADACIDQQLLVHHGARDTASSIDALALGSGSARIVANARTTIAAGSDEAQTRQRLAGVPTSGQPRLTLRPHLEIHHDQVQAAHGATWGAMPEDALFHARQRGIDEVTAKAMIVEGMAAAVFARALGDPTVLESAGFAARMSDAIAAHLATGRKELHHG